jgi:hypothetical protein
MLAARTAAPIRIPIPQCRSETASGVPSPASAGDRDRLRVRIALLALVQYGVADVSGAPPGVAVGVPDRLDPLPSR